MSYIKQVSWAMARDTCFFEQVGWWREIYYCPLIIFEPFLGFVLLEGICDFKI